MQHHAIIGVSSRSCGACVSSKHALARRTVTCAEQPQRTRNVQQGSRGNDATSDYTSKKDVDRGRGTQQAQPLRQAGRLDRNTRSKQRSSGPKGAKTPSLRTYKIYTTRIVKCKDLTSLLELVVSIGPQFNYVNTASALVRAWLHTSIACFHPSAHRSRPDGNLGSDSNVLGCYRQPVLSRRRWQWLLSTRTLLVAKAALHG